MTNTRRRLHAFLAVAIGLLVGSKIGTAATDKPDETRKETLWVIPHTHWEGAVFKTREEYLDVGLPHILKVIQLLKKYPDYRFVLDQVAYVKPFMERYPEEAAAFHQFVKEGRLELVLGMDIMPDTNLPGGETLLRQIQYGKSYYRQEFGVDVTVGWLLDSFGHNGQMPQILKLAGYKSFWSQRGANRADHPAEFLWEGIDGTRIPAFLLPNTYALFANYPAVLAQFNGYVQNRWDLLTPHATGPNRVALAGADITEPDDTLPQMVEQYGMERNAPLHLRFGTPTQYEEAVATHPPLSVYKGELNPIFQGTFSSRIELKQWHRLLEQRLTLAEKLACLSHSLGKEADSALIWRAWEPLLFNSAHDLASGVMTNSVYTDTLRGFEFSKRLADEAVDTNFSTLSSNVDTRGEGIAAIVFNPLGWERTDFAQLTVGFSEPGIMALGAIDPAGNPAPLQTMNETRFAEGGIKTADVAFIAKNIPALGYATYRIVPHAATAPNAPIAIATPDTLENEFYHIGLDSKTGAITSLKVKDGGWEVFRAPANVITRQEDKGDLWSLYRGLNGAQKLFITDKQSIPQTGQARFSTEFPAADAPRISAGPVFAEFNLFHAFDDGTFATRVRIFSGIRRIDLKTDLVNNQRQVRYQALFPTTIKGGANWQSIPFGAIERPEGIEYPAQTWADYGDGKHGLSILNYAHPGNVMTDGTMMLSLLRAHNLGGYGFGGGYEDGMSSDTGFEIGKRRELTYSLVPHRGDWREAGIYRDAMEFNNPLVVRKSTLHPGSLPPRWGFVQISKPNAVLSALKPGQGGSTIVRVFETTGVATPGVKMKFTYDPTSACETNLMEDPVRNVPVIDSGFEFDLKPFEIKTFAVQIQSMK